MTRTLESFQETGWRADAGYHLRAAIITETAVTIAALPEQDGYRATLIVSCVASGVTLCISEREFATEEELMQTLGIDDLDEVWEDLD